MIRKIEVAEAARAWGLSHHIVEKDYVLGWVLIGLSTNQRLQNQWIFKGGTCLKKCYLETYRFSEDLDFTLTSAANINVEEITELIKNICGWVSQESGIEIPPDRIEFKSAPNQRGTLTLRGKLGYRGPLQQPSYPTIRFDLTTDELIALPPIFRPVHHPYSDHPPQPVRIRCYPIEEILAEKTRAMVERCMPRDLYDIIRMFRFEKPNFDAQSMRELIMLKSAHRNLAMPSFEAVNSSPRRLELESEWANMLSHQLPTLPPLETYLEELSHYFDWLEGKPIPELHPIQEVTPSDTTWQQPEYISLPSDWGIAAPIEAIRFAGANRLRIHLHYLPKEGLVGVREVEPYSFRLSKAGQLLFYARNIQRPRISAYRVDRIVDVEVTTNPFIPVWRVEF
jgi:predicted nucleotidyltransferase component of viral defense system